jgi:hypothetical protein
VKKVRFQERLRNTFKDSTATLQVSKWNLKSDLPALPCPNSYISYLGYSLQLTTIMEAYHSNKFLFDGISGQVGEKFLCLDGEW